MQQREGNFSPPGRGLGKDAAFSLLLETHCFGRREETLGSFMLVCLTLNAGRSESKEGELGLHHCPRFGELQYPRPHGPQSWTSVLTKDWGSLLPLKSNSGTNYCGLSQQPQLRTTEVNSEAVQPAAMFGLHQRELCL